MPTEAAIFTWGSVDRAGNFYVVYDSTDGQTGDHYHQYYVYWTDHGASRSQPVRLDTLAHDTGAAIYATSAAGAPGMLDVDWCQTGVAPGSSDRALLDFPQAVTNPVTGMAGIAYADNGPHTGGTGEVDFSRADDRACPPWLLRLVARWRTIPRTPAT